MPVHTNPSPQLGAISRSGAEIRIEATDDLASAEFCKRGGARAGNQEAQRIYARRLVACYRACQGSPTEALEEMVSAGHSLASLARSADAWVAERDKRLAKILELEAKHESGAGKAQQLYDALNGLLCDIKGLMAESSGVAGLHMNGDVAPWSELTEGGRFERLSHMSAAAAALQAAQTPEGG